MRLRHVGFDGEDVEAHFSGEVFENAVLQLKELARAVGRFAQRHDARLAHDLLQAGHVAEAAAGLGRLQADGVPRDPLPHRVRGLGGRLRQRRQAAR